MTGRKTNHWKRRHFCTSGLVFRGYSQCSIAHVSDWHLNLTYCFHLISLLLSFLVRLINPPGFWWLSVRLLHPTISRSCSFPSASMYIFYFAPIFICHLALQYLPDCRYPQQTVLGGFFINLFADIGEMHGRKASQKQGENMVSSVGREGPPSSCCAQEFPIAMKILNISCIRCWTATKRHRRANVQGDLLVRETFAHKASCRPDLWLQTSFLGAFSTSSYIPSNKLCFESSLWRSPLASLTSRIG